MRIFAQLDQNNLVVAILDTDGVPGAGTSIPAGFIELTNRSDGPWAGKIYTSATDSFSSPVPTKTQFEGAAIAKYQNWQIWKTTRAEAQARAVPAGIVAALTVKENGAWNDYAQALLDWYNANG